MSCASTASTPSMAATEFSARHGYLLVASIQIVRRRTPSAPRFFPGIAGGMTDKDVEHLFEAEAQAADLVERAREYFVGDALAVDEHAVTIENDQIEAAAHSGYSFESSSSSSFLMTVVASAIIDAMSLRLDGTTSVLPSFARLPNWCT